jgi:hypothetical protein
MIAQILRDERKLLPADASQLAAYICKRLAAAMATPTNQPLQSYRIIPASPPYESDFEAALRSKIADAWRENCGRWSMIAVVIFPRRLPIREGTKVTKCERDGPVPQGPPSYPRK